MVIALKYFEDSVAIFFLTSKDRHEELSEWISEMMDL